MPRYARIVVPGRPHHVTQRGNNRQDIFFVDDDRVRYLEILSKYADRFGLSVDGYCLMTNHVHLIATPAQADSLALVLGRTHMVYAQYINRLHGRSGHLWQNRFYSCPLDGAHFLTAMIYIERNPVRASVARRASRYPWSSAAAHCGGADQSGLLAAAARWRESLPSDVDWRQWLAEPMDDEALARVRLSTSRGRPLGSDRFIAKLERLVGRRLRPLPVGRPRKRKSSRGRQKPERTTPAPGDDGK